MRRRHFITLLTGAAVWPLAARAQQPAKMPRIGMLLPRRDAGDAEVAAGVLRLRELGWTDGQTIRIDYRWIAGTDVELLRSNAAELVSLAPDVIWVLSNPAVAALQRATRTVPTVFVQVADPVASGFVESLARPGGNTTGFTNFEASMGGKWLEMLKDLAPRTTRALVLFHPETAAHRAFLRSMEAAASRLDVALTQTGIRNAADIERALVSFPDEPNGGLIPLPHPVPAIHRDLIIGWATQRRVPTVYPFRYYANSGGLLSYGSDATDLWRRSASYVDRILRGEKPADLPVQAPTKFELVINLKTAKAIGIEIPQMLLARSDEVIE